MKKEIKLYFNSANGTWRYRYRQGGKTKDFYSTNPNERKALAEIKQKIARFELGITAKDRVTVETVIDEYIAYYAKRVSRYGVVCLKSRLKKLVPVKAMHIADVKKMDWQRLLDTVIEESSLSISTARRIKGDIIALCKYAASCGYISDYDVPLFFQLTGTPQKGKKALTPEQVKKLFEPSSDWYIHAFRFLVLTGLRRAELCALMLERDYDGFAIHIRESMTPLGERTTGKTKQAQRTIYLSDAAKAEIEAHLSERKSKGITSASLFCTTRGDSIPPNSLNTRWNQARKNLGIQDVTLHELRHTHITYTATKSGLDLRTKKSFTVTPKAWIRPLYTYMI